MFIPILAIIVILTLLLNHDNNNCNNDDNNCNNNDDNNDDNDDDHNLLLTPNYFPRCHRNYCNFFFICFYFFFYSPQCSRPLSQDSRFRTPLIRRYETPKYCCRKYFRYYEIN